MEDFRQNVQLVNGGHVTEAPATVTYSSVVARDTVRITLLLAVLNDLDIKVGDVLNAYITAPLNEKIWTVLGLCALYGLKTASGAFHTHLTACMQEIGFKSCLVNPDLWYKEMT